MRRFSPAAFLRLARPKFLAGGIVAFALGAAVARVEGAAISPGTYLLGQAMVSAFHAMVHFANDYFDRDGDRLAVRTPWSGGSGALVDGSLAPAVALRAALVCAGAGALAAAAFLARGNWPAAGVGVAIGLLAWAYSAPPWRLLARGLGEADTALVVAVLVPCAGYATFAGSLDARVLLAALPGAAAMLAMMFCVEFPDLEADRASGKRNLVVRAGRGGARAYIYATIAATYVAAGTVAMMTGTSRPLLLLILAAPPAAGLYRRLAAGRFGSPADDAAIAGRGVAFFVLTLTGGTLGYLVSM